jgi:large subunit ribosomal protein L6
MTPRIENFILGVKVRKKVMSRIGKKAIILPVGVSTQITPTEVVVKGPKGEIKVGILPGITVAVQENNLSVSRTNEERQTRAYHGLIRSLLNNAVTGVTQGYKITLKLVGTGYRATMKGQGLSLALGFSHPVEIVAEPGVKLTIEGNDTIHIEGIEKQVIGQVAANIRKIRPPEPYKGKGIRYVDEVVRRKAGKAASK